MFGVRMVCVDVCCSDGVVFFFFKQKTAYEMRISDWSSDVCSSDLACRLPQRVFEQACHALGNRQAQAKTLPERAVTATKLFKNQALLAWRDPAPGVPYLDLQHRAVAPHTEQHAAPFGIAHRIGHKVLQPRPAARRVWKEGVSTCQNRWSR